MKYNRFMGEYDDNTIYQAGDVVNFDGASYYRKVPGKGISPIARKKPYTVWSRLNEALSTIFPLGGPGGGGASLPDAAPYRQLVTDGEGKWVAEDRLAWEEKVLDISWDGNTEGLVADSDGAFYKVSDTVFTAEELIGSKVTMSNGDSYENTKGAIYEDENFIWDSRESIVVIKNGNVQDEYGITYPETGTYFKKNYEGIYVAKLEKGTPHPIPAEYIPRIVFTYDGTNYTCNVPFDEFEAAVMNGLPTTFVDTSSTFRALYNTLKVVLFDDGSANINVFVFDLYSETGYVLLYDINYTSSGLSNNVPPV